MRHCINATITRNLLRAGTGTKWVESAVFCQNILDYLFALPVVHAFLQKSLAGAGTVDKVRSLPSPSNLKTSEGGTSTADKSAYYQITNIDTL